MVGTRRRKRLIARRKPPVPVGEPLMTVPEAGPLDSCVLFVSYHAMDKKLKDLGETALRHYFCRIFPEYANKVSDPLLMDLALRYQAQAEDYSRCGWPMPDAVKARYEAIFTFDPLKVDAALGVPGTRMLRALRFGDNDMTSKSGKEKKAPRKSVATFLVPVFDRAAVPDDESIITMVRKEFPTGKFDAKQLAWYKSRYRQGALKGMDGRKHEIAQAAKKSKASKAKTKAKAKAGKADPQDTTQAAKKKRKKRSAGS